MKNFIMKVLGFIFFSLFITSLCIMTPFIPYKMAMYIMGFVLPFMGVTAILLAAIIFFMKED